MRWTVLVKHTVAQTEKNALLSYIAGIAMPEPGST
jgi:hypothetical protein